MCRKISVVIPVYNAEKFLRRCLDSVIGQTLAEKEIICVDDGSTDGSPEILKEYGERYEYVHILTQKNQYAGAARNYGLSRAEGEYIHFLDADDYILGDVYADVYNTAKQTRADYVKTRNAAFDMESGEKIKNERYSLENWDPEFFNKLTSAEESPGILLKTSVAPWSGFVRRKFILEKGIIFNHLRCVNDRSFYAEVIGNTDRIVVSDLYVVAHQVNNTESLVGIRNENYGCHLQSYQWIKERSANFPAHIRKKILAEELYDLAWFYSTLTPEQRKKNEESLREFFQEFEWEDIDTDMLFNPVINEIYQNFQIHVGDIFKKRLQIDSIAELQKCIEGKRNIVICGAGRVCEKVMGYMARCNFSGISCIVVSDTAGNPESICGVPVKKKSKEILDKAQIILIAALEKAHMAIYRDLLYWGFQNVKIIGSSVLEELSDFGR